MLCRQAKDGHYFQIKSPPLRTQFYTPMGCNVKLLFWRQMCCHCSQPNYKPHVTSRLHLSQWRLLEKEEYYTSVLERQAGTLPSLPWSKCAAFFCLKRASLKALYFELLLVMVIDHLLIWGCLPQNVVLLESSGPNSCKELLVAFSVGPKYFSSQQLHKVILALKLRKLQQLQCKACKLTPQSKERKAS